MTEQVKYRFGVKALVFYDRDTFKPVGIFRVVSSVEFAREIEKLTLNGGHRNGPWAVEAGEPTNTLTATLMQFPNFAFTELDNAVAVSTTGEDSTGFVDTIANKSGTSVFDATTGIASVAAISGSEALLPAGKIVVVADTTTTVNVYLLGDVGNGPIPVTDELPLLAAGVTIPDAGGTVEVAAYGLEFTGGSGTVAMTAADTAFFETRPTNSKTVKITMPDISDVKELGCILVYPKNSAKQQRIVEFPKVAVAGTPFAANTREFAEFEFTGTPLYDEDELSLYVDTEIQSVS